MKTIYKLLFIAMAMTMFTGCYGAQVSVGAGEVGRAPKEISKEAADEHHDELKDFAESFEETDVE